jgi:hypothetical protein
MTTVPVTLMFIILASATMAASVGFHFHVSITQVKNYP